MLLDVCWHLNAHVCVGWGHIEIVSVEHVIGSQCQPCSHPAASKQQMAGLDAVADLDRLCLLGSNCVLTWRETKYYSQAGKQIIVTSLAGRWLYLSHVQMEFEEKKLAQDVAWAGCTYVCSLCVCIWLFACPSVCLLIYLSVYLFVFSAAACLLPHISYVCLSVFVLWRMFQCCRSLYQKVQQRKNIIKWIRASVHLPLHCATGCPSMPNTALGDVL